MKEGPADSVLAPVVNSSGERERLSADIARLRGEIERASEPIVKDALSAKLAELEEMLGRLPEEERVLPPPPSLDASQRTEFERGLGRLRLFLTRDDWSSFEKETDALAKNFGEQAEILEARGDLAVHRRRSEEAERHYRAAHRLAPANIGIERKFGNASLVAKGLGTWGEIGSAHFGTNAIIDADVVARGPVATILSFIVPGLGQFVLGQQVKGLAFFVAYLIEISILLLFKREEMLGLLHTIGITPARGSEPSGIFYFALLAYCITVIWAIQDCAAIAKRAPSRTIERPKPPVDLPFE